MSLTLWEDALRDLSTRPSPAPEVRWRRADGSSDLLALASWSGPLDECDQLILQRLCAAAGPVLDVGCGPGRFAAAAAAAGLPSLGIDIAPTAVQLARARGAAAAVASIFDELPREGHWRHILLIDGNVGIGGCPSALLRRCSALLADSGTIHVELNPPGTRERTGLVRLEHAGRLGDWFPWAEVAPAGLRKVAGRCGLEIRRVWTAQQRWFAELHGQRNP